MRESTFKSTIFVGVHRVSPDRGSAGVCGLIVSFWGSRVFISFFESHSGRPQFGRAYTDIGG